MMGRPKKSIKIICAYCGKVLERSAWDVRRRRNLGSKNSYCNTEHYRLHRRRKKLLLIQRVKRLRKSRLTLKQIGERLRPKVTPQRVWAILEEAESV